MKSKVKWFVILGIPLVVIAIYSMEYKNIRYI